MARTPAPTQSPAQRENRRIIKSISNVWRISLQNRRPRGLKNIGDNCYRLSLLQNLLHLPRFVNWIRQHNTKNQNWPCNTEHSKSLHEIKKDDLSDLVKETNAKLKKECVPCLLKDLVVAYWSADKYDEDGSRNLAVFPHEHDAMLPIHRIAERFFCRRPENHDVVLTSRTNINRSQAYKDHLTQTLWEGSMTAQQDAQELMNHLLGWGCEESLDHARNHRRLNQYKALFQTVYDESRVCSECADTKETTVVNFGQRVSPLTSGRDTLEAAFARAMTAESLISNDDPDGNPNKNNHVRCDACNEKRVNLNSTMCIRSAPEYMCIHINLFAKDNAGTPFKNRNSMQIPDILDLTQHVQTVDGRPAAPLRYKLVDVVYHVGERLNSGHYTAGVTGPDQDQFFINDSDVEPWDNSAQTNVLTANPATQKKWKSDYDPYLLFYEYIPNRKKEVKPVAAINEESSIAERIRGKRLHRKHRGEYPTRRAREAKEGV